MCPVPNEYGVTNINEWLDQFVLTSPNQDNDFRLASILSTLWCIWKARNLKIFENKNPNPYEILMTINGYTRDYFEINNGPSSKPMNQNPINPLVTIKKDRAGWRPPREIGSWPFWDCL